MSHFTVLVIGENWEEQLAPYQENNMEDCPKEYLKFYDIEDEYRNQYENDSVEKVVMPDGSLKNTWSLKIPWDEDDCLKNPNEIFSKANILDNLERRQVAFTELYPTFEEYMNDWCGYKERDKETKRYGYWENPNKKWDWYIMGGRWTGFFKLKINFTEDEQAMLNAINSKAEKHVTIYDIDFWRKLWLQSPTDFNKIMKKYEFWNESSPITGDIISLVLSSRDPIIPYHKKGSPGIMTEEASDGFVDQARKKDIDFEGMAEKDVEWAAGRYDKFHEILNGRTLPVWSEILQKHRENVKQAREEYWGNKAVEDTIKEGFYLWGDEDVKPFLMSKEDFLARTRKKAIMTFAVVKDGEWFERREMGWFGATHSDKMTEEQWEEFFVNLIEELPDETLLTLVDCHI